MKNHSFINNSAGMRCKKFISIILTLTLVFSVFSIRNTMLKTAIQPLFLRTSGSLSSAKQNGARNWVADIVVTIFCAVGLFAVTAVHFTVPRCGIPPTNTAV